MLDSRLAVFFGLLLSPVAATGGCCKTGDFCYSGDWVEEKDCGWGGVFHPDHTCTTVKKKMKCVANGKMKSDPILTGFDNTTFEFFGKAGRSYSLLMGETFAVNVQLVEAGPENFLHPGEGTFVGGVGVNLAQPALGLLAYVDQPGNLTFTLDGVSQNIELPATFHDGLVTYEPYVPGLGQVLTVSQPPFSIQLVAVKHFSHEQSGYHRGHLNLQAGLTGPTSGRFFGVLGETLYNSLETNSVDESRFEVPSLSYTAATGSMTRRRLSAIQVVDFPASAQLASRL